MASDPPPGEAPPPDSEPKPASFLRVLVAVFWSFFGVRKRAAGERDMVTIKLVHVVIAGLLGAAFLVAVMITLVRVITYKG